MSSFCVTVLLPTCAVQVTCENVRDVPFDLVAPWARVAVVTTKHRDQRRECGDDGAPIRARTMKDCGERLHVSAPLAGRGTPFPGRRGSQTVNVSQYDRGRTR